MVLAAQELGLDARDQLVDLLLGELQDARGDREGVRLDRLEHGEEVVLADLFESGVFCPGADGDL